MRVYGGPLSSSKSHRHSRVLEGRSGFLFTRYRTRHYSLDGMTGPTRVIEAVRAGYRLLDSPSITRRAARSAPPFDVRACHVTNDRDIETAQAHHPF